MTGLAWTTDGSQLAAAGSLSDTVHIWDALEGEWLYTLVGEGDGLWSLTWMPDGALIASGSDDGAVIIWPAPGEAE